MLRKRIQKQPIGLPLTTGERKLLLDDFHIIDDEYLARIKEAPADRPEIPYTFDELDDFCSQIAFEADHVKSRKRQKALDMICERIHRLREVVLALEQIRNAPPKKRTVALSQSKSKMAPIGGTPKAEPSRRRTRGTFNETAEEMILSSLKGREPMTTSQLAAAWKKSGRGGKVDNVLSRMVKTKKLIRKPLEGKRGSEYNVA